MSKGLKLTFLIHAITSLFFGIGLFVIPGQLAALYKWSPFDPTLSRALGAALIAFSVSSWLGYRATSWKQVGIILLTEITLTVFSSLGYLYSILVEEAPPFTWVIFIISAVFGILWIYFYARAPKAG